MQADRLTMESPAASQRPLNDSGLTAADRLGRLMERAIRRKPRLQKVVGGAGPGTGREIGVSCGLPGAALANGNPQDQALARQRQNGRDDDRQRRADTAQLR